MKTTAVNEKKKKIVDDFSKLAKDYPIVGAVNMEGMPTPQLQKMREQLRDKVELKMTKKRLIKLAIEKCGIKGLEKLVPHLKGQPALIFTKENPFKLFKTLQKSKSTAPAKGGQIAPKDIVVQAGTTEFAPGPIIGELGALGIKAGIDGGKVAIKEDSVVVKEGEEISQTLAEILTRLKIEPMEIGLDLTATVEDGELFTKSVLNIDEDEYRQNLIAAHSWAFNLAMNANILNDVTTPLMVIKAYSEAKSLALSQDIMADKVVGDILAKAESQMRSLNALIPKSVDEKKEVPAAEEKTEEPKEKAKEEETSKEGASEEKVKEAKAEEKKKAAKAQSSETASADKPEVKKDKDEKAPKKDDKGNEPAGLGALFE